ncbi:hypothetical protein VDG1235_254 [Verrucomicrobiia bacterium DG1235]|nr:hypothetical protein VDG1235_254 [Verrucomicrobiae bacterium DG1235]
MFELAPQYVPKKIDAQILEFANEIVNGNKPTYVKVDPPKKAKILNCFHNVEDKIKIDGGEIIYGWEISIIPQLYLEAQFHAVWKSPFGALRCMTPSEIGSKKILFLEDPNRTYKGARVENLRFSLGDKSKVDRYIFLMDLIQDKLRSFMMAGFPPGHPRYEELYPHSVEARRIRESIQNQ